MTNPPGQAATTVDRIPGPIVHDPFGGFLRSALHAAYDASWLLAGLLGSPWLLWKSATVSGFGRMLRERTGRSWPDAPLDSGRQRILLHGVSVGEVKAAQPVVRALREAHPETEIVVSTTTNTGEEVARQLFPEHLVVRFPADVSFLVRRFFTRVRPECVVLVELEIWPNFLREANQLGIPVAVVNGRITHRSFESYTRFKRLLPQFDRISLYCVQDAVYARRFLDLGVEPDRLVVTGNVKLDGLPVGRVEPGAELAAALGGAPGQLVVVAGSTHQPEERLVAGALRAAAPEARLILVPRHPERAAEIVRALGQDGPAPQLWTELRSGAVRPDPRRPAIVDTIGELESVYGLADVAYVGGSLVPHGGQNLLEPAAQGLPVLCGPHVENFQVEAALLENAGACRRVGDADELAVALGELLGDPDRRTRMAEAGLRAVRSQGGATALTLAALERGLLGRGDESPVDSSPDPGYPG